MARGKKKSPAWAWLLTGMLIGLFAAFLVYLNDTRGSSGPSAKTERPAGKKQNSSEASGAKFDFYTILPDMEIPVPDIQEILPDFTAPPHTQSPSSNTSPTNISNPVAEGTYVLQAGAFRSVEEADRLKAKMALLGVIAHIESAEINGITWHRVRIGPYANMAKLNDANNRLKENGITAMLLKLKG
ncbi:MAG: SPOR domain-containing protein [Gammaproteobacteria bacterium]|nr:SPOR domain-containing protein [Gammaproteobacteria bacterium]